MNKFAKRGAQIRAESPIPWVSLEAGMGLIRVIGAVGKEAPLLRVLALVTKLIAHLAAMKPTIAPAAEPVTKARG